MAASDSLTRRVEALLALYPNRPRSEIRRALKARDRPQTVDPITAAEERIEEKSRKSPHRGPQIRRLHKAGKITVKQLYAAEAWAADYWIVQAPVKSCLDINEARGGAGGGDNLAASNIDLNAWRRWTDGRDAMLALPQGHFVEMITHRIVLQNKSPTAAVAETMRKRAMTAEEAIGVLRRGLDAVEKKYR
ncbi:MAG: hypothetical protein K0R61_3667 [Microvirga sp.]|jgi:hypothetical protein|nr:hypothetical protein [Microvirga sp.]